MNKSTKRLAAIGAAMTMAVSMMSIGVSAASWKILFAPGAGGLNYTQYTVTSQASSSYALIQSACTSYSANSSSAKVSYNTFKTNANGTVITDKDYSLSTDTNHPGYHKKVWTYNNWLKNGIFYPYYLNVRYNLVPSNTPSNIKGTVSMF